MTTQPNNYHVNEFSKMVFEKKYKGNKENIFQIFDEAVNKIRNYYIKDSVYDKIKDDIDNLHDALYKGRFIFGGRILAAFGAEDTRKLSYYNCTNINIIEDSLEGIFDAMYKVARVSSRGQGVGIDFSVLRPRAAKVNNAARTSTGAVSYMRLFDNLGTTIAQDGDGNSPGRRMAMLFTLDVSHPDIEEFIDSKRQEGSITNANISVLLTKEFLDAVKNDGMWELKFNGTVYKALRAKDLMDKISESNRSSAEPGVLFIDNAKKDALPNILGFPIVGFNACTEAVLDYAGVCNLGSLNLGSYYDETAEGGWTNWEQLNKDVRSAVLALDTIVSLEFDEERVPIKEQGHSQNNLRRIGLGVMGLADLLALAGYEYDGNDKNTAKYVNDVMGDITNEAFKYSAKLANLLGAADAIKRKPDVISHPFLQKLDKEVQQEISKFGLRNAAIISIAPTGSISNIIGCSSGIEPLYRKQYSRFTRLSGEWEEINYTHPVYERNPNALWMEAKDVSPMSKLAMVALVQNWVDQSISNTGNFPAGTTSEDITEYYFKAFDLGAKGLTVFVESEETYAIRGAVLKESTEKETQLEVIPEMDLYQGTACKIDFTTGETKCD